MSKENGEKKKSKKPLFIILAVVAVLVILMVALMSGDDESTDGSSDTYYEDNDTVRKSQSSEIIDFTSEKDFPMGTCKELDGTIVIMSIAANDAKTSWDFNDPKDQETLSYISREFSIGLDWITEQGKKYGKDIKFIYDWDEDNELFYTANLLEDYGNQESNLQDQKSFIDENLSQYATNLVKKYNADGIAFVYYFNMPENTDFICFASPFQGTDLGMDYPIETLCIDRYVYGAEQGPATYAHELLHLFGAPDLYQVDMNGLNYGMTAEFVDYCEQEHKNEIMFSTYDPYNMVIPKDEVTNDLTDLTAYYIGWIDSNEECESFGVANSAH